MIDALSLATPETKAASRTAATPRAWVRVLQRAEQAEGALTFEPKYNPALLGNDDFPLFDLGLERG